ncbi:unnamed protein product [Didymodactylos carnosus]|uniref:Uncharacterized protein n=1 Tax=Didymodactylos carnosus TaxID=1234261 RepID=A0A8S2QVX4_9BILA|nr:unnamed protein product [Didymodactylos carnosus]CAF4124134.1 unnamed protein product [Didymodactylos carnosus]
MTTLSHDIAGLILPHDQYGSHLNADGKTIDVVLEKENFCKAGETLAEVWSSTVIDSFPVVAQYVEHSDFAAEENLDEKWCSLPVVQTQYACQIVRCNSIECCGQWRSNYIQIFPHRFLPAPVPFQHTSEGLEVAQTDNGSGAFMALFLKD